MLPLLKIPQYIVIPVLSEWLTIKDFVNLTIAVNTNDKSALKSLCSDFQHCFCKLLCNEDLCLSRNVLLWFEKYHFSGIKGHLTFDGMDTLNEDHKSDAVSVCYNNIHTLKLCGNREGSHGAIYLDILHQCNQLYELMLEVKNNKDRLVFPFQYVLQDLPLRILRLSGYMDMELLVPMLRYCPQLVELYCDAVCCETRQFICSVCVWCRQLKVFQVSMDANDYFVLAMHTPNRLTEFLIGSACEPLQIRSLLHYCGGYELQILKIESGVQWVESVSCISDLAPCLTQLTCYVVSVDAELINAMLSIQKLSILNLSWFFDADEDTLVSLLNSGLPLQQLETKHCIANSKLKKLRMSDSLQVLRLDRLTHSLNDDCLVTIGTCCPVLTELHIALHDGISDSGILAVILNKRLKVLNINRCKGLTEHTLVLLSRHCVDLTILYCAGISVSSSFLWDLISNCRSLKLLWFSNGTDLSLEECEETIPRLNRRLKFTVYGLPEEEDDYECL